MQLAAAMRYYCTNSMSASRTSTNPWGYQWVSAVIKIPFLEVRHIPSAAAVMQLVIMMIIYIAAPIMWRQCICSDKQCYLLCILPSGKYIYRSSCTSRRPDAIIEHEWCVPAVWILTTQTICAACVLVVIISLYQRVCVHCVQLIK